MTSIKKLWDEYAEATLPSSVMPKTPKSIESIQYIETRRAFYAGVVSIMGLMRTEIASMDEDEGAAALQMLWEECERFYHEVRQNKK